MSKFDEVRIVVGRQLANLAGFALLALIVKTFFPDTSDRVSDQEFLLGALGMCLTASLAVLGVGGKMRASVANVLHLWADTHSTSKKRQKRRPAMTKAGPVDVPDQGSESADTGTDHSSAQE